MANERVKVIAGNGGRDSLEWARMLGEMYGAWDGDLSHEPGVHRLVRRSPFDKSSRRFTCFALVVVDGEIARLGAQVRSYVCDPYQLVTDHLTGIRSGEVHRVLAGELDLILPTTNPGKDGQQHD